jgi:hypothetical protein
MGERHYGKNKRRNRCVVVRHVPISRRSQIAASRKLDRTQYLDGGLKLRFSIREKEIQL